MSTRASDDVLLFGARTEPALTNVMLHEGNPLNKTYLLGLKVIMVFLFQNNSNRIVLAKYFKRANVFSSLTRLYHLCFGADPTHKSCLLICIYSLSVTGVDHTFTQQYPSQTNRKSISVIVIGVCSKEVTNGPRS